MNLRRPFYHSLVLGIMRLEDSENSRSIPVCGYGRFRWMNQRQLEVIDYLRVENRVLREQLGDRRLQLNDNQRRRLAIRAKGLGREDAGRGGYDCER